MKGPLSATNPRMVAPPGVIKLGDGPVVIVATMPRVGTHLMIDLLLNHFDVFQKTPLYVNLDHLFQNDENLISSERLAGNVVKTHFPFAEGSPERRELVRSLLDSQNVKVIRVIRPLEASHASHNQMFETQVEEEDYVESCLDFDSYWKTCNPLTVEFGELIDVGNYPQLIEKVGQFIGVSANGKCHVPTPKKARITAYFYKAMTRLFSHRTYKISTGIKLSKK